MKPQTSHILLHTNGDHRPLSGETPPSDDLVRGAEKSIVTQGRPGAYVARVVGMPRDENITQVGTVGSPNASFEDAKTKFLERNRQWRSQTGNRSMFNN